MDHPIRQLAVIGAGNMGSGIAQKMASEGFPVVLVDLDEDKVARGLDGIRATLAQGVERRIFRQDKADAILRRIEGTADWSRLADADLVVEAVFEDAEVKRAVFERLDEVCRRDAILATNTSSFSVTRIAAATKHPERVVGLHYFYHPAKNRLVEVIPGERTAPDVISAAWALQERAGKTPIASSDTFGFIVNRYFVPWLNEAVRILEEGIADIPTIEAACRETFGVGMGPFELMNVTGIPIALHSATTLGQELGSLYAPARRLQEQVTAGEPWPLDGDPDPGAQSVIADRMLSVVFHVAGALVEEGVGTVEDTDIGARVGLRWPRGPFELMNRVGIDKTRTLVRELAAKWELTVPRRLETQFEANRPFDFELVRSRTVDGVATLTINRPDAMNALSESVVDQLHEALRRAAEDPGVRGIVIAGAGKAFIAGADIRFFVRNIKSGNLDRIERFTRAGHALLNAIDQCDKPVVARVHGLALGGGLELALACHAIVATRTATLAFPETGIGIYPGLGGTQRTPRRIGVGLAKWLIYTGQMIDARTAHDIGLVDRVVDHAELDAAVHKAMEVARPDEAATWPIAYADIARVFEQQPLSLLLDGGGQAQESRKDPGIAKALSKIAAKAPLALRLAEHLIDRGMNGSLADGLELELSHLGQIFGSEDALEGLSSVGRRRPEFKGR